jgi:hypothetical protein
VVAVAEERLLGGLAHLLVDDAELEVVDEDVPRKEKAAINDNYLQALVHIMESGESKDNQCNPFCRNFWGPTCPEVR